MKRGLILLSLAVAGCASGQPGTGMPDIPPAQSDLVFTGSESCEDLRRMYSRAHNDEALFGPQVAANYPSKDFQAFFTLGISNLEFDAHTSAVARARGDMLVLREEMIRRQCFTVGATSSAGS